MKNLMALATQSMAVTLFMLIVGVPAMAADQEQAQAIDGASVNTTSEAVDTQEKADSFQAVGQIKDAEQMALNSLTDEELDAVEGGMLPHFEVIGGTLYLVYEGEDFTIACTARSCVMF